MHKYGISPYIYGIEGRGVSNSESIGSAPYSTAMIFLVDKVWMSLYNVRYDRFGTVEG